MTEPSQASHRDVELTPFQRRVYAVVKRIPKGEVRSYQWVARALGNTRLARAVGQALKRNPHPIRVPCHRVIRSDGSLGGYAWGVAMKRRLLRQEQHALSCRRASTRRGRTNCHPFVSVLHYTDEEATCHDH